MQKKRPPIIAVEYKMTILFPYMARWNSANRSRYYHVFNKIAEAGHTVIVVQPPPRESEETNYIDLPMEIPDNIKLYTVRIYSWLWNIKFPNDKFFKKALYTVASYFTIRSLVKEYKPDVLVLYNLPQFLYTFGNKLPIVFDYADDYLAMLQHELGVSQKHIFVKFGSFVLNRLIKHASLVTAVSQVLQEHIDHPNKLLLPNGAAVNSANNEPSVLHIDKHRPVVGYVGAFEYFIDLRLMLDCAERLPAYTFLFVGAGREFLPFKDTVAKRKLHNVILTGAVPHRQAMQFISEMDICLNLFEMGKVSDAASPIKLFEYIAQGKPVISTRLKEIQRLDKEFQSLFYADNIDELINTIDYILHHPDLQTQRMQRAIEIVRTNFSWDTLAHTFINKLKGTINAT